ncbi:poly-gamma-glutamate biosynthesis protein PgsC [Akkermansiaceae bacterium]|nr:poly-gamma-glutamate biosynthesis protein PgsC [Akkermansiaceae bacterium]
MIDPEILVVAIGVGLAVSLLFSELFGLAAGGLVVPGYVALFIDKPLVILATILVAICTWLIVKLLGSMMILFGKRRTVLVILVAYLLRLVFDYSLAETFSTYAAGDDAGLIVIGYIIPGLIALWFDRQGVIQTLATLAAASVAVRMILILVFGSSILFS